ncbi:AP4AT protein, partial [Amia calva]|nr:AP4AT protein [Amia calva]
MKATSDDETPCPGYLFEEIGKISHESTGCCQCLLEYLLERLQADSCHVKLKVLKILLHLCGHSSHHFLTELRRNATFVQEVIVFSGPPDPVHGNALYQRVRTTAQELASVLFADTVSPQPAVSPCKAASPSLGMGSDSGLRSGMQGFGYSPGKQVSNGTLLDRIQKAAEVVASAVLPPTEHPGIRLHDNNYRPVVAPCAVVEVAVPACAYSLPAQSNRAAQRCPGQAGGGWEESDSGHSSQNSSNENGDLCRASVGGSSKSGTDSQSGASRESGDLSERVEVLHLGDCAQEMILINSLTQGSKVFLTREEMQHFLKECAILNCEVVVELLCRKLQDPTQFSQMRALCAVACLMSSDLLSLDHIFGVTQKHLVQLSEGSPGAVANKATKILRQFEALMGGQQGAVRRDGTFCSVTAGPLPLDEPSKVTGAILLPTPRTGTSLSLEGSHDPESESSFSSGQNNISSPPGSEWESQCHQAEVEHCGSEHLDQFMDSATKDLSSRDSEQLQINSPCSADASVDPELSGKGAQAGGSVSHLNPGSETQEAPAGFPTGTLSLFSGMELVTVGKPVCFPSPHTVQDTDADRPADSADSCTEHNARTSPTPTPDCGCSQQPSAFSFINI